MKNNRFLSFVNYLEDEQISRFTSKRPSNLSKAKIKDSKCKQVSEAAIGSDAFVLDVLEFFFNERLTTNQLNDQLRQVAADAAWRATEGSEAMDLVPRPPAGRPGVLWLVSQAVQIAFRRAQNRCIYEAVRVTVKLALRSDYELAKMSSEMKSFYSQPFTTKLSLSAQGINFIKYFESYKGNLYNDPAGHCTIGYGTLVHRGNCDGSEPQEYKSGITEQRATELLLKEVNQVETVVNSSVTVTLNQPQFDALVSFAYNCGTSAFRGSTLLKLLNQGNYDAVPGELKKWIYANKVVLPGLVKRREAEAKMFSSGVYTTSLSYTYNWFTRMMANILPEVHLFNKNNTPITRNGSSGRAYMLNETNQPGIRLGTSALADPAYLTKIVDWLDVENSQRYLPNGGSTYCNIYAYDYCCFAGAYIPRVWWVSSITNPTADQISNPKYEKEVNELTANAIYDWFGNNGSNFGWFEEVPNGDYTSIQNYANQGHVCIIVYKNSGGIGHICAIVPEVNGQNAIRNTQNLVVNPLQSQSGRKCHKYFTNNWWGNNANVKFYVKKLN